jgi:uncharacterized small protein (DUF1192 family)
MRAFRRQKRAAERAGRSANKHDRHIQKLEARIAQLEAENARLMAQLAAKVEPKRKAARRPAESENSPFGKKSNSSPLGLTEKTSPNRLMWESDDRSGRFPHRADAGNGMRYSIREVGAIAPGSTCRPIEHRHQLPIGRAILGGNGCTSLPQSMSRALGQTGFVTTIPEPVAESIRGEWFAVFRDEEGQLPGRALSDDVRQYRQDGFYGGGHSLVARFSRDVAQKPVFDVLLAERHNITATCPSEQHQRQCQSRLGADGMAFLKLAIFINRPSTKSVSGI